MYIRVIHVHSILVYSREPDIVVCTRQRTLFHFKNVLISALVDSGYDVLKSHTRSLSHNSSSVVIHIEQKENT